MLKKNQDLSASKTQLQKNIYKSNNRCRDFHRVRMYNLGHFVKNFICFYGFAFKKTIYTTLYAILCYIRVLGMSTFKKSSC